MKNPKRQAMMAALGKPEKTQKVVIPQPEKAIGDIDAKVEAEIDSGLNFHKLQRSLEEAGMTLQEFLAKQSGIKLSKPERKVTTPYGDTYTVASTHLSYEQLKDLCLIDDDNVRDKSERTEEALSDIIDEIGMGFQLLPIITYIDDNGKHPIMEGSRRFACAMIRKVGLDVDIYSPKPDATAIRWIVEASDRKKSFSYFEKGELYSKLMDTHGWSKADLERERGYDQTNISLSVGFFTAPKSILDLLPSKALPQTFVRKFNSATTKVLEKKLLDDAVSQVKARTLGIETLSSINQAKKVVDVWKEVADGITSSKVKGKQPEFQHGQAKAFVTRTKNGSNIKVDAVPKELEEQVLAAIKDVLATQ